jgi:hypothetical protein
MRTEPEFSLPIVTHRGMREVQIHDAHTIPPFLMNVTGDSEVWLFLSSVGGLTAGRRDAEHAIFAYETEDRLHRAYGRSGPICTMRIVRGDQSWTWAPLDPEVRRNSGYGLSKSILGNRVISRIAHAPTGLQLELRWQTCDRFGLVRTAWLSNPGPTPVRIDLVDGALDVLPAMVPLSTQQRSSVLVDAYRHSEIESTSGLAVYALSSKITDRAEPAEALAANVAWSRGLPDPTTTVCPTGLESWNRDEAVAVVDELTGRKAGFFVQSAFELGSGSELRWDMAFDAHRDHAEVDDLVGWLTTETDWGDSIETELARASDGLWRIIAGADAQQRSGAPAVDANHLSNVMFNTMRGGVFVDDGRIPSRDFADFVASTNRSVYDAHATWLDQLPPTLGVLELREQLSRRGEPNLLRHGLEYLPLTFSRRHGDPSRPWNRFSIQLHDEDGDRELRYEGNWRDIFQNWEALLISYPEFAPHVVSKFVNASTVDGFNPYRISRQGIDWEVPEPDDPWSNIGYWGDHQVIYLVRLLEAWARNEPEGLGTMLHQRLFTYADVPYRIRPYEELLRDPRDSIEFDLDAHRACEKRTESVGADGRLLPDEDGTPVRVTLAEKLLVPVLSKLSNLVVDGGIWMNTQRPEWNDANNALAGPGLSMVTWCQLRRYVVFLTQLLKRDGPTTLELSSAVAQWLHDVRRTLLGSEDFVTSQPTARNRRRILDALGRAFDQYRSRVYERGLGRPETIGTAGALELLDVSLRFLDHGIRANRRDDGLYHGYNVLEVDPEGENAQVHPLYPMLEGQVGVLDACVLEPQEVVDLVDALFRSPLYRADQDSFLLYPDRRLHGFLGRNRIGRRPAEEIPLLRSLLQQGDRRLVVAAHAAGPVHFASALSNAQELHRVLDELAQEDPWRTMVDHDRGRIAALYEEVFGHASFTGRSGGMYAYEGLGSIYWHMVAKLLVGIQEAHRRARQSGTDDATLARLAAAYHRVRRGFGFNKSPRHYGAFPTDAYSHTPRHAGAQQPGMTGQVKEQIITRFGELGVEIDGRRVSFRPRLLRSGELCPEGTDWRWLDRSGQWQTEALPAGSLAFTLCHVPVVYRSSPEPTIDLTEHGRTRTIAGPTLDEEASSALLSRSGGIDRIVVGIRVDELFQG